MPDTLASTTTAAPSAPPSDPGEFGPSITPAPRAAPQPPAPAQQPAPARPTPGSKAWAEMTTEQRHEQLRGPPNPRAVGHSPARDQREAAAARAAGEAPPAADQQQETPAATGPGEKFKIGKYEVSEQEVRELMADKAARELRAASVPPTPDAYKLEISPDAKLPGDIAVKFDPSDAGLIAAKNWAHSKGLDQSAFSEMLTLYASHVAQQEAALAEVSRAEIAKAGANAPQRMDAVTRWITAEVGEADARPIRATIVTDSHLRFYEKLMNKISSQGTASFSQQHRVAPDTGGIPGYENMSFEQRRFAKDQAAARTRR
jgi:hypothetical protein